MLNLKIMIIFNSIRWMILRRQLHAICEVESKLCRVRYLQGVAAHALI